MDVSVLVCMFVQAETHMQTCAVLHLICTGDCSLMAKMTSSMRSADLAADPLGRMDQSLLDEQIAASLAAEASTLFTVETPGAGSSCHSCEDDEMMDVDLPSSFEQQQQQQVQFQQQQQQQQQQQTDLDEQLAAMLAMQGSPSSSAWPGSLAAWQLNSQMAAAMEMSQQMATAGASQEAQVSHSDAHYIP